MKSKLLTAALVAATVLSLPALADGGGKIRPNYRDGGSQVSRGDQRGHGGQAANRYGSRNGSYDNRQGASRYSGRSGSYDNRQAASRYSGRRGSYDSHQGADWRHDGRYDRRDFWADSYRHNQQGGHDGGHGGYNGGYNGGYGGGHGGHNYGYYGHGGHNHGHYGGRYYYSPRWYGGNPYRYSYGVGYGPWYGGCGYDDRYDHWDGYRWRRTYCDADGFLFYYGDGGIVIQLSSW